VFLKELSEEELVSIIEKSPGFTDLTPDNQLEVKTTVPKFFPTITLP